MDIFHHHQFPHWAKVLKTLFFWEAEKQIEMRQLTIQTLIYCLIYSFGRKAFRKIMHHKEIRFVL